MRTPVRARWGSKRSAAARRGACLWRAAGGRWKRSERICTRWELRGGRAWERGRWGRRWGGRRGILYLWIRRTRWRGSMRRRWGKWGKKTGVRSQGTKRLEEAEG